MKKILFYLLSATFILSCAPKSYKIEGEVQIRELSGKTILIKERINRVWTALDSVKIENGSFHFQGSCDTAKIAFLCFELPSGEKVRRPFVLENGKIEVLIDTLNNIQFQGTQQNEILQKYFSEKKSFYISAENTYKALSDSSVGSQQRLELEKEVKNLEKKEVEIDKKYAAEYVNTVAGTYIFESSFYSMTIEEKEKIIGLMNDLTKKRTRVIEIIQGIETEKKTAKGQVFIDIKLPSTNGDSIALSSLIGKTDYVLIDFWASWCGPCMQSLPELKSFYNKYKNSKIEIFGVSLDDDAAAWKGTVEKQKLIWKHVSDLQGWKSEGAKKYAISSIPATILINKQGIIEGRNLSLTEIENLFRKSGK